MGRPRLFGRPAHLEKTVIRTPNPVTSFEVGVVDAAWGRGMQGNNGAVIIGEPSSPERRYAGELGPQQFFRGGVPLARQRADRKGFNQALPSTHGPVVSDNAVLDLLGRVPN